MFKSYLTVAIRSLLKRRGYSAINIVGLATGMAAVIVILLFAHHELTYDRFHERADDLYLVYKERITPTGTQVTRDTWVPLAARLEQEYPAVEDAVRFWTVGEWIRVGAQRFQEDVTYADPALFSAFTFPLAGGDVADLDDLSWAVLDAETATKFFGDRDPIGQTFHMENGADYVVRGVLEDIPANSSFDIDIAIPLESARFYEEVVEEW